LFFQMIFSVGGEKFAVLANIFPVILAGDLQEKSLRHRPFLKEGLRRAADFFWIPCKIPC